MRNILLSTMVTIGLSVVPAAATVYDFEDIGGFSGRAFFPGEGLTNYQGWSWPSSSGSNYWAVVENIDSQFESAHSGTKALWNASGGGVRDIIFDTAKTVGGGYFSVFKPGETWSAETVQFNGYDANDALIGSSSVLNLDNSSGNGNVWLYLAANLIGVKRLEIISTNSQFGGAGWWALDDLEVSPVSAVPVPAALPLFGTGLAVMGFIGWRRKRKAA